MLQLFLIMLLLDGASGAESNESVTVMEGDSVTLHTNLTEVLNDDTILWLFGPKESVISQITRKADFTSFFVTDDMRFRGRLLVDQKTGSLTIRNTRIRHSGKYKLTISREKTTTKIFNVTVIGVVGETDGMMSVSVMEGNSVTLLSDVSEAQRDDLIVWRFGHKGILLAKIDVENKEISLNDADERFRNRLTLDQTGSLTIKNTRTTDSGLYELQVRGRESSQRFLLSINAVPDLGQSPGVIAGIIVVAALVLAAVVSSVVVYYRSKISELEKKTIEEKKVKVEDGISVTLEPDTTEQIDKAKWWYQDDSNLIAEFNRGAHGETHGGFDERFRSKLLLNENGSLTINNTMAIHSGLYLLEFSNKTRTINKRFILTVKMKTKSVKEGHFITLKTDTKIQIEDEILWTFGAENCLVVKADTDIMTIGKRFKDRLELDRSNGSLTIRNLTSTDSGHFKLQIINSEQTTFRRVNVIVKGSTGGQENESTTENILLLNKNEVYL